MRPSRAAAVWFLLAAVLVGGCTSSAHPAQRRSTSTRASTATPDVATTTGTTSTSLAQTTTTVELTPVKIVVTPCGSQPAVEPSSIVLACADGNASVENLVWASWGQSEARASGNYVANDCTPSCAGGTFHRYPAAVILGDVGTVRGTGYFTTLTVLFSGSSPFVTSEGHEFDLDTPYIGLYPFVSFGEVRSWEKSNAANPAEAWHLDAAQTALRFTQKFLLFTGIDQVVATATDAQGTHVTVGYRTAGHEVTVAAIRLLRTDSSAGSPWEVEGTDIGVSLRITAPPDGAEISNPHSFEISGTLTSSSTRGLYVEAFAPATYQGEQPVGQTYQVTGGGVNCTWRTSVDITDTVGPVTTVVVAIGEPESDTQSTITTTPDAFAVIAVPYQL